MLCSLVFALLGYGGRVGANKKHGDFWQSSRRHSGARRETGFPAGAGRLIFLSGSFSLVDRIA